MFRRSLPRSYWQYSKPRSIPNTGSPQAVRRYATEPPPTIPAAKSPQSRLDRLNRRLPKFLHRHTAALANAPVTHIVSFLLLHELTAIVPLFGLAATFHYTDYLPPYFAEGAWVLKGVDMFGKWFKRRGWIRGEEAAEAQIEAQEHVQQHKGETTLKRRDKAWHFSEGGVRWVVEFATAWAVVKVLLPVRIVASVWATPWFARWTVVPVQNTVKRWFGRSK